MIQKSGDELDKLASASAGETLTVKPRDWVGYYTRFDLPASVRENGGSLCFRNMTGKATIYLNGEAVHERKSSTAGDVVIRLQKDLKTIELNVFMQPDNRGALLLGDIIYITPEKLKKTAGKKIDPEAQSEKK